MIALQFWHLVSYGILLGSQAFQTCINGIVAFKALHRPYFSIHQAAIFPVYFSLQASTPIIVFLTSYRENHLSGILSEPSRNSAWWPMVAVSMSGLINLTIFRPLTRNVVRAKKIQEIRDNKKSNDLPPHSPEMTALNKRFWKLHATSIGINIFGLFATIHYGAKLSNRLS